MHMSRSAGHEASASLPPLPLCEHLSTVPVPGAGSEVPAQTCLRRNDGPSEQVTCLRIPPTLSTRTNVPAEKTPPPRYTNERACKITTSPRYTNERACEETAPPSHSDERAYGETTAPSEQFWCLRVPTPPSTRLTTVPALGEIPGCTYQ